jgi:type II secretion system protein N
MKTSTRIILWVGIIVYGLALFFALTFYRLPAERILTETVERVSDGKMLLSVGKASSSVWKGHHLEDLTWTLHSGDSVVVERMSSLILSTSFLRILQGYVPVRLKGALAKGSFQISAGISMFRGLNKGFANIEAAGIELGELGALSLFAQRQIKGKLRGQADLHGSLKDLRKIHGQGTFFVEDGAVELKAEGFGIKTLSFAKLTLPLFVKDAVADLKGGEIAGPLFAGDFEGQIRLQQNLQASPVQVKARIRPAPSFQDKQAGKLPPGGDRPMVIQLQGTLARPVISWTGAFQ